MKILNINDYRCSVCRSPSLPGVCGLCSSRQKTAEAEKAGISTDTRFLWAGIAVMVGAVVLWRLVVWGWLIA